MSEYAYHEVPYRTVPGAKLHPDRLASVATLFGMKPAPVSACRVLEIGCGSGANLIPMAYYLPGGRFTGVDLADRAVSEGKRVVNEIGLGNIGLLAMDLREIGPEQGEFDYIIAHGVYSWVPPEVREGLMRVCRERLAPQGVACISYNTLPGRYVRTMLREMMLYHTRDVAEPVTKMALARDLMARLRDARMVSGGWQPMVEEEVERALEGEDGWFYHDDLSSTNDAFYIRDFAAHARKHGLQYLGDAEAHTMFDVRNPLDWVKGDTIEREQYLDFLALRRFRFTLLCREDVELERPANPMRMDGFSFCSPATRSEGQIEGLHSVSITEGAEAVTRVALAMGSVYPMPAAFDELLPFAGDRETLRGVVFTLIASGFASFHVHDFRSMQGVNERPRANRLARWEAQRLGMVTYSNHMPFKTDPIVRTLIGLLDGTRDLDALVAGLANVEGAPPVEAIRGHLPRVLDHMARTGLLEA
ncbi:MAG: class I SAM-dependent methyltransferase [Acidobacteria bacterium]|nr:class I SAM-dependent methyltransferase [Acidobacteriota bacterium]